MTDNIYRIFRWDLDTDMPTAFLADIKRERGEVRTRAFYVRELHIIMEYLHHVQFLSDKIPVSSFLCGIPVLQSQARACGAAAVTQSDRIHFVPSSLLR